MIATVMLTRERHGYDDPAVYRWALVEVYYLSDAKAKATRHWRSDLDDNSDLQVTALDLEDGIRLLSRRGVYYEEFDFTMPRQ